jgi:hypothetical protein
VTMCSIFNCDKRHGSYCCAECQERKECRNPCQNGPERCGQVKKTKEERKNGKV